MPKLLRKKKANESFLKYLFSLSHLWLGLLSSLILIVVCLTGSLLVFEQPIKNWANRAHRKVEVGAEKVSLDLLKQKYVDTFGAEPGRITVPASSNEAIHFFTFNRQTGERISAFANPYTGEFTGEESQALIGFFSTTLRLHRWLLVRGPGKQIVGAATVIFLFLCLSGLVLWWPKRWKQVKQGLKIKWNAKFYRVNYDLHSVLGFYALLGLFFLGATGLYFSYPSVRNGINVAFGADVEEVAQSGSGHSHGPQSNTRQGNRGANQREGRNRNQAGGRKNNLNILDQGIQKVNEELIYSSDVIINLPGRRSDNYRFKKSNRNNWLRAYLPDYIELNGRGRQVNKQLYSDLPLNEQVTTIMRPMHTGEIAGWPSMILYFVLCLIGTSLPITGFIIWYKRESKIAKKVRQEKHNYERCRLQKI